MGAAASADYTGLDNREEIAKAHRRGRLLEDMQWELATKRGVLHTMPEGPYKGPTQWAEHKTARVRTIVEQQVRTIVEHPFHVIKNLFGYRKVSYRELAKNHAQTLMQAAMVTLVIAKRRLQDERIRQKMAS